MKLNELESPSFIVNRHIFTSNCQDVLKSPASSYQTTAEEENDNNISTEHQQLSIRPHVKTHKCTQGAFIQAFPFDDKKTKNQNSSITTSTQNETKTMNVVGFVASTIPEIEMLFECAKIHKTMSPFGNILYGIPISKMKFRRLVQLHHQFQTLESSWKLNVEVVGNEQNENSYFKLHVLVDNPGQVQMLEEEIISSSRIVSEYDDHKFHCKDSQRWSVYLKVDTGYHRAGVTVDNSGVQVAISIIESKYLNLKGLYSHCGHAYNINDQNELQQVISQDHNKLVQFLTSIQQELVSTHNHSQSEASHIVSSIDISVGSTPTAQLHSQNNIFAKSIPNNNIEIHPGNYVFFDRQQLWVGSCCQSETQISVRVLSRVISHYKDPDRNCIILDCGALALTKDASPQGGVCSIDGYPELECYRMSQEVIMVRLRKRGNTSTNSDVDGNQIEFPFHDFPLGMEIFLIPNHSCLSAACFDRYYVTDEKDGTFNGDHEIVDEWIPCKGW